MFNILKGGNVVLYSHDRGKHELVPCCDVLIEGGKISAVGPDLDLSKHGFVTPIEIIDCSGKLIITSGGIDPHQLLPEEQRLLLILLRILLRPHRVSSESYSSTLDKRKKEAEEGAVADFTLHMTMNMTAPTHLSEIPDIISKGVRSSKIYLAYDGIRLTSAQLIPALEAIARHKGIAIVHAETHDMIMSEQQKVKSKGLSHPKHHCGCHPAIGEELAIHAFG
ncbi:hypothetical protein ADUPG1_010602, partial [Aduncisulcus paluster]